MFTKKTAIFFSLLIFSIFSLSPRPGGAASGDLLKDFFGLKRGPRVEEEFHKTLPLTSDGYFSLSNVNGKVTLSTWSKNEVDIRAIKSTRYGRDFKAVINFT